MVKLVSNKEIKEIEEKERNGVSDSTLLEEESESSNFDESAGELQDKKEEIPEELDEKDSTIQTLDELFKNVDQFIVSSDTDSTKLQDIEAEEKEKAPFKDLNFNFSQDKATSTKKVLSAEPSESAKPSETEENIKSENAENSDLNSEVATSAKEKVEADFQTMNPFGKATYLLAGSLVNGVSQLLLGSAHLMGEAGKKFSSNLGRVPLMNKDASLAYANEVKAKLKETKFNESMEGIHAIENLSDFFEDKFFNDFNAHLGKSNKLSTDEKQEMSSAFIERYGKHFPGFKKAMEEAELLICDSDSKLEFFAKNLDDSEESKNKFTTYIERLESLRDRVPPWLNIGKTNVVSFLDQLLEKAKELFFSKFGMAYDQGSNVQMNMN